MSGSLPVSAIIVHYGTPDRLRDCLEDLASRPDAPSQVIVVDNGSLEARGHWREQFPGIDWVFLEANRGFAAGVNAGARRAFAEFLLFLNPDARLDSGALFRLSAFIATRANAGVVSPLLVSSTATPQPTGGEFPTLASLLARKLVRIVRRSGPAHLVGSGTVVLDWVSATAMLCRRAAFDAVSGMDDEFFMYYEDCDFCFRLRMAGWRSYLCADARAVHEGGASFRGDQRRQVRVFRLGEDRYFRKHRPRWESQGLKLLRPLYDRLDLRENLYPRSKGRVPER